MTGIQVRRAAWCAVILIAAWLLWMTLRPSGEISLPGVRMGEPLSDVNLRPFSHKITAVKDLLASSLPSTRRSARTYLIVDLLGNVAVFAPLGAALTIASWPLRADRGRNRRLSAREGLRIIGTGFLLSVSIELIQLAIPSRATDVDDVILNTLGTAAGAGMMWGMYRLTGKQ